MSNSYQSNAYQEYLELFEYFGRGGMVCLRRAEFDALQREFEQLLEMGAARSERQLRRLVELRELLLRERPRVRDLVAGRA